MCRTGFLSIVRSLVLYTQQQVYVIPVMLTACQRDQDGNAVSITCMTYNYCCVYSTRLLMMDRGAVRNMQSFIPKINLRNQCIQLVLLQEYITMHGHLNVKVFSFFVNLFTKEMAGFKTCRHPPPHECRATKDLSTIYCKGLLHTVSIRRFCAQ